MATFAKDIQAPMRSNNTKAQPILPEKSGQIPQYLLKTPIRNDAWWKSRS